MPEVIGIQLIKGGLVHYYYPAKNGDQLHLHDFCVVETEHGLQMAKVVHPVKQISKKYLPEKLKPVLRAATKNDHDQFSKNEQKAKEAYKFCRQKVIEKKLDMKLVDVAYALDARKAVFYFTADNRVDFRELVKDLAHAFKVKIEMRQIGVRDEARRLGGVGCCGRTLCCCTFLKDFVSVSIRMAKEQHLSLNPTKVSGLCGRLMCCLSYEYLGKGQHKKTEEAEMSTASQHEAKVGHPAKLGKDGGAQSHCGQCHSSKLETGQSESATTPNENLGQDSQTGQQPAEGTETAKPEQRKQKHHHHPRKRYHQSKNKK